MIIKNAIYIYCYFLQFIDPYLFGVISVIVSLVRASSLFSLLPLVALTRRAALRQLREAGDPRITASLAS